MTAYAEKHAAQNHAGSCFILMKEDKNRSIMMRSASSVTDIRNVEFSIVIPGIIPSTTAGI